MVAVLTEPKNAIVKQFKRLFEPGWRGAALHPGGAARRRA